MKTVQELENSEIIVGTVEKIIFQSSITGFTVLELTDGSDEITAVGTMPDVKEGEELELSGNFTVHHTYGQQFKVEVYSKLLPSGAAAILKYLSSGTLHGIGPATAKKIVNRFGDQALEIMENHPRELSCINGITFSKALEISEELKKRKSIREIIAKLTGFGINANEAVEIFKVLGADAAEQVRDNPYLLCGEAIGFDFSRVDKMAESIDFPKDSQARINAGVKFVLEHNLLNGHTCLPRKKLCEVASALLGCDEARSDDAIEEMLYALQLKREIMNGKEFVFINELYFTEKDSAQRLSVLQTYSDTLPNLSESEILSFRETTGIELESLQLQAVNSALSEAVLILTGGPGTGKTTTLNAIITAMKNRGLKISLAAPTGRAAKRMTELCGEEAKTVHRLLEVEWSPKDMAHIFKKNERDPLECDVLIVDEMSMVDVFVFNAMLRALRLGSRLILVGDSDQLPSVGAGNVLQDLMDSGAIYSVRLKKVFRQSLKSLIISNAHGIVNGVMPQLSRRDADFFMIERTNAYDAAELVVDLCTRRLPESYGFSPTDSIQVLTPSRKRQLGTVNLNNMLQKKINPEDMRKNQINFRGITLREGDKVMQIKNNYDVLWETDSGECGFGVFNGDIGTLEKIDTVSHTVKVRFDNRVATYTGEQATELELAYAVTVHKSQGNEFECVILPLMDMPYQLKYRNLLYTAVTRAKKMLVAVGSKKTVEAMVNNNKKTLRYTALKHFIEQMKTI